MKPAGTIEADLGVVNMSTGVQVRLRVVWHSGRTYLELTMEPRGDGAGGGQGFRPVHIRSDRIEDFIARCTEAHDLIGARGIRHRRRKGVPPVLARPSSGPAAACKKIPNPAFSHACAREAGQ